MGDTAAPSGSNKSTPRRGRHRRWVRICHWLGVVCFLTLGVSGIVILMAHPRLYWGEVGNDLMPALLEFPIGNVHRPEGWERAVQFTSFGEGAVSANRVYEIFNQNSWGRSLHFLGAWVLVATGLAYVIAGAISGHIRRNLLPPLRSLAPRSLWCDVKNHLRREFDAESGPPYGLLQRCAYVSVVFVALPLMVVTGLAMSPAVSSAYPFLLDLFGGYQSARTVHFFCFAALFLFLIVHVAMVLMTGFRRHMRAMTLGD